MSTKNVTMELALNQAAKGKVSRREFMQLAIGAGLTVPAASQLFVSAARAEPKRGGVLRLGLSQGASTDNLDPATNNNAMTTTANWGSAGSSLTEVDVDGNIVPDLAESFEPLNGGASWRFVIRNGVTFHDGRSVAPEDVIASFRRHMGESSKSVIKSTLKQVVNIKADGNNAVIFDLQGANADFPFYAADIHLPIMQAKADGSANWASPVRTGPFIFETFEPGVRAVLKRNPNYYRDVWFDEVHITTIADVAARTNALLTGEIDYMDRCSLKTLSRLEQMSNIEVDKVTGYEHYIFVMDVTQAPFDNSDVRRALKYAINREEINTKVFFGLHMPGNDNPIPPSVPFAINPEPVHTYDPEKARALLKQAGLDTLTINLSAADVAFTGAVEAALLFKEQAKAAGIEINVVRESSDNYWDSVWMKKPFVATFWSGRPIIDPMFTAAYTTGATSNETRWSNPRFDELLVAARSELDPDRRAAMYAEMQQMVHDDGGLINLAFSTYVSAHSKRVAHGKIASNWDIDGRRIASRWWVAE